MYIHTKNKYDHRSENRIGTTPRETNLQLHSYLCKYVGTSNAKTLLKSNVQTLDNNKSHHENKIRVTNITASCHCEPQQTELKKVPCENENYLQTVYTGITAAQQEESSAGGLTLLISVY